MQRSHKSRLITSSAVLAQSVKRPVYAGPITSTISFLSVEKDQPKTRILQALDFNNSVISVEAETPEFEIFPDEEVKKTGVLARFYNQPISFWDIPTLNLMTYPKAIWEKLLNGDEFTRSSLTQRCLWGASDHSDLDYVQFSNGGPSICVNKFWLSSNNLVLGEIDILDTSSGRDLFTCAKHGSIGVSSRGVGQLLPDFEHGCTVFGIDSTDPSRRPIQLATSAEEWDRVCKNPTFFNYDIEPQGWTIVDPEDYINICWDAVSYPAVPKAVFSVLPAETYSEIQNSQEVSSPEARLRKFLAASAKNTSIFQSDLKKILQKKI